MTNLYIIRGVPGSGKTTLAERMIECGMVEIHCEADAHMTGSMGQYEFNPSRLKECHKLCQDAAERSIYHGIDTVVSNTFTRKWEMQHYLDMAEKHGAKVTVIVCQGDYGNVHGVPNDKVSEMKRRFEY